MAAWCFVILANKYFMTDNEMQVKYLVSIKKMINTLCLDRFYDY